ncbi:uncharacterized [Tachysurus ichikawai]
MEIFRTTLSLLMIFSAAAASERSVWADRIFSDGEGSRSIRRSNGARWNFPLESNSHSMQHVKTRHSYKSQRKIKAALVEMCLIPLTLLTHKRCLILMKAFKCHSVELNYFSSTEHR